MKNLRTRCLTLLSALLFCIYSNAETYSFASIEYEPFGYIENQTIKGIIPEIATAIADEADIEIDITLLPYSRVVNYTKSGEVDFAIFSRNADNDGEVEYIAKLFVQNVILLTRKGDKLDNQEDIYNPEKIKNIGYLRGTNFCPEMLKDKRLVMHKINDFSQGLKMLNSHRISAFLTIDTTALYESHKLGLQDAFEFPGYSMKKIEAWLQIPKVQSQSKAFPVDRVRSAADKLRAEGSIEAILRKHLNHSL